jgi:sugar O-acyltransferase (sialic acid O-acetyltransferase NeuD family)
MRDATDRLVIVGASGHALVALDAALRQGACEVAGFLDSFKPAGQVVAGYPILGHPDDVDALMQEHRFQRVFLGISDNVTRQAVYERMRAVAPDLVLTSIIHPASCIAASARIGPGTLVLAGAIVNAGCVVGENCIINTKASLDHDSELKPYASMLPGVTTGGNVVIGRYSCVCIGATLSHRVTIGEHTFIGAGAVVLKDVPACALACGVPAEVIRSRKPGEKHF